MEMEITDALPEISHSGLVTLHKNRTSLLRISINSTEEPRNKELTLSGIVKNVLIAPETGLSVDFVIKVDYIATEK